MQAIRHTNHNINEIFSLIEQAYAITSVKHGGNTLIQMDFPEVFNSLFKTFYERSGINYPVTYSNRKLPAISQAHTPSTVILCFSGGKDSTATALRYKEQGENVILYHLRGINKTYKDEWKNAEKVADKLGLQLVTEEVTLSGNQEWVEHPMKNMIIANMALQHGITNNITTRIAFGNFSTSTLDSDPFDVCGGDCREMWDCYNTIIQSVLPKFEMETPLESMKDTLDILMRHKDIAVLCQSCIGPYRYRDYLHDNNCKKYNIDLPEHRCGSCWKCCLEYIVYCDNDIYEYNADFYKHCLEILQKTLKTETGFKYTLEETWNHYFFYDRMGSKYYRKCWKQVRIQNKRKL